MNRRQRMIVYSLISAMLLTSVVLAGALLSEENLTSQLEYRNLPPSFEHIFGTDWLGRDMFARTMKGLTLSIGVGLSAAFLSSILAVLLGLSAAAFGKTVDRMVTWFIDLFLSVPHLVTLILISFVLGGGAKGVIVGIALTHWPSLSRVIRAEVMQLRAAEYIQISKQLGKSRLWVAFRHMFPHLLPQFIVGLLLIFPHAILHEAALTFIGMGLSPHQPAIGVILSESMRYLSTGMWWLALFPGICLLVIVRAFDVLGENLKQLVDPRQAHE